MYSPFKIVEAVVVFLLCVEVPLLEIFACMAIILFNVIVVAYSCLTFMSLSLVFPFSLGGAGPGMEWERAPDP